MNDTALDVLVLTAANEAQARGYAAQLAARQRDGRLAGVRQWRVIADPGGRRVGSGGSTLWVLRQVADLLGAKGTAGATAATFDAARVLIVHSGGDSRRLVAYTAQGKVFTPLPCDVPGHGRRAPAMPGATLFDLILADLRALPFTGVLLAAGDVLLTFDHDAVRLDRPGVTGVAYPGPLQRGSRHGVYVADAAHAVVDFLQKPDAARAHAAGAVDAAERVLVDTGLIRLDGAAVARWLRLARRLLPDIASGRSPAIDLYEQLLIALPQRVALPGYLDAVAGKVDAAHRRRLQRIYRELHGQPFHVNVLPYCEFFHIGTSRELLANMNTLSRTARQYGFANLHRAVIRDGAAVEGAFIFNSILSSRLVRAGEGVLIEAVHTDRPLQLPGRNIVVGLPAHARARLALPEGWGLVCLPIRRRGQRRGRGRGGDQPWTVVVFGDHDDFKTPRTHGGTFGNQPLDAMLARHGIDASDVWRHGQEHCLWDARLWPVGPIDEALSGSLQWTGDRRVALPRQRMSMREILAAVDHDRLLEHRDELRRLGDLHRLGDRLTREPWLVAEEVVADVRSSADRRLAVGHIERVADHADDPLLRARLAWLGSMLATRRGESQQFRHAALAHVARAVQQQTTLPHAPRPAAILPDQVVWATTPVRIDFAGGWSDTPPICTELGGAVVNAAITLNGQYPVQVIAKLSEGEPVIKLSSIDLGASAVLRDAADVLSYTDPTDWAALPKAALVLAGVAPHDPRQSLRRWLEKLGGGLDITLFSALPKGSGLGTSSVLGAATLACLARVHGESLSNDALFQGTSVLEQMMTTGGGWQDQVGGVTPGIKLVTTEPGAAQTPALQWTAAPLDRDADARPRLLLYFTGHKRLARNILQNVVGRYLARDPDTLATLARLKADALRMKADLDRGDFDAWTAGVERYWRLKQSIDAGSTNPRIEALLKPINRYLDARLLPGAGGGGFVFMVARDPDAAQRVRATLDRQPPNPHARFFDFSFDPHGLRVTVL